MSAHSHDSYLASASSSGGNNHNKSRPSLATVTPRRPHSYHPRRRCLPHHEDDDEDATQPKVFLGAAKTTSISPNDVRQFGTTTGNNNNNVDVTVAANNGTSCEATSVSLSSNSHSNSHTSTSASRSHSHSFSHSTSLNSSFATAPQHHDGDDYSSIDSRSPLQQHLHQTWQIGNHNNHPKATALPPLGLDEDDEENEDDSSSDSAHNNILSSSFLFQSKYGSSPLAQKLSYRRPRQADTDRTPTGSVCATSREEQRQPPPLPRPEEWHPSKCLEKEMDPHPSKKCESLVTTQKPRQPFFWENNGWLGGHHPQPHSSHNQMVEPRHYFGSSNEDEGEDDGNNHNNFPDTVSSAPTIVHKTPSPPSHKEAMMERRQSTETPDDELVMANRPPSRHYRNDLVGLLQRELDRTKKMEFGKSNNRPMTTTTTTITPPKEVNKDGNNRSAKLAPPGTSPGSDHYPMSSSMISGNWKDFESPAQLVFRDDDDDDDHGAVAMAHRVSPSKECSFLLNQSRLFNISMESDFGASSAGIAEQQQQQDEEEEGISVATDVLRRQMNFPPKSWENGNGNTNNNSHSMLSVEEIVLPSQETLAQGQEKNEGSSQENRQPEPEVEDGNGLTKEFTSNAIFQSKDDLCLLEKRSGSRSPNTLSERLDRRSTITSQQLSAMPPRHHDATVQPKLAEFVTAGGKRDPHAKFDKNYLRLLLQDNEEEISLHHDEKEIVLPGFPDEPAATVKQNEYQHLSYNNLSMNDAMDTSLYDTHQPARFQRSLSAWDVLEALRGQDIALQPRSPRLVLSQVDYRRQNNLQYPLNEPWPAQPPRGHRPESDREEVSTVPAVSPRRLLWSGDVSDIMPTENDSHLSANDDTQGHSRAFENLFQVKDDMFVLPKFGQRLYSENDSRLRPKPTIEPMGLELRGVVTEDVSGIMPLVDDPSLMRTFDLTNPMFHPDLVGVTSLEEETESVFEPNDSEAAGVSIDLKDYVQSAAQIFRNSVLESTLVYHDTIEPTESEMERMDKLTKPMPEERSEKDEDDDNADDVDVVDDKSIDSLREELAMVEKSFETAGTFDFEKDSAVSSKKEAFVGNLAVATEECLLVDLAIRPKQKRRVVYLPFPWSTPELLLVPHNELKPPPEALRSLLPPPHPGEQEDLSESRSSDEAELDVEAEEPALSHDDVAILYRGPEPPPTGRKLQGSRVKALLRSFSSMYSTNNVSYFCVDCGCTQSKCHCNMTAPEDDAVHSNRIESVYSIDVGTIMSDPSAKFLMVKAPETEKKKKSRKKTGRKVSTRKGRKKQRKDRRGEAASAPPPSADAPRPLLVEERSTATPKPPDPGLVDAVHHHLERLAENESSLVTRANSAVVDGVVSVPKLDMDKDASLQADVISVGRNADPARMTIDARNALVPKPPPSPCNNSNTSPAPAPAPTLTELNVLFPLSRGPDDDTEIRSVPAPAPAPTLAELNILFPNSRGPDADGDDRSACDKSRSAHGSMIRNDQLRPTKPSFNGIQQNSSVEESCSSSSGDSEDLKIVKIGKTVSEDAVKQTSEADRETRVIEADDLLESLETQLRERRQRKAKSINVGSSVSDVSDPDSPAKTLKPRKKKRVRKLVRAVRKKVGRIMNRLGGKRVSG